jgi:hypothetical protein
MRPLIIAAIYLFSSVSFARTCKQYDKVAEYLNTQKFVKASRDHRALKREPTLNLGDINQARSLSYKFPAFEDLGFSKPGGPGWESYVGRHPRSGLNGKNIGWEIRNEKGHARIRLDWDPEKGAHYNIEIMERNFGKTETHKLAVSFLCGNVKCSESQLLKMAERMQ